MKFGIAALIFIGVILAASDTVLADTEYRCLRDCLNAGAVSPGQCLASCTYTPLAATRPGPAASGSVPGTPSATATPGPAAPGSVPSLQSRNAQFTPPAPVNQLYVGAPTNIGIPGYATPGRVLSPTTQALGPSTNYQCINACSQKGYQHDYCVGTCSY